MQQVRNFFGVQRSPVGCASACCKFKNYKRSNVGPTYGRKGT
jgi:hypothetical protein